MKVLYLILLVVVALEACLAVAGANETVVVKPARKGKSPKKIRRTIRVREAAPAQPEAPVQLAPQQQPAAQPINNEVNVNPDISVHVSPQQQQQHHPNQQQPLVHIQTPAGEPEQQIVVHQQPTPQPIVELPDDDEDSDDDDHSVRAENMQIVPYEQPEQSIVPVNQPELEEPDQLQIVPLSDRASELVDMGSEQVKRMLLRAGDLMPPFFTRNPNTGALVPTSVGAQQQLLDPNITYNHPLNANNINKSRYNHPLGWPATVMGAVAGYPAAAFAATPVASIAGQMPVIQVNIDGQARGQPWFGQPSTYAAMSATPYVGAAAAAPIWQQPAAATSFMAASPVGAAMPTGPIYQAAANPMMGFGGYPMMPPMVQQAPAMMMPQVAVQQMPAMMMQPAIMMQPTIFSPPAEMRIRKKKSKKQKKQPKVVVEEVEEEPVVEEKTTWVKKEPQFNQFVEQPATTKTVVTETAKPQQQQVEVVEKPEEIEWETVRIPKIKKNDATAAGQQ